jgi:hypothetical protein
VEFEGFKTRRLGQGLTIKGNNRRPKSIFLVDGEPITKTKAMPLESRLVGLPSLPNALGNKISHNMNWFS